MKRLLIVSGILLMILVNNVYAYTSNPTDCSSFSVGCVRSQFHVDNHGLWSPKYGVVTFYGDEKKFEVFLYFDAASKSFYQNNPWAGFEIDIDSDRNMPKIDKNSVRGPSGTKPLRDTVVGDWSTDIRGITVTRPSEIKIGWNAFSFQLEDDISDNTEIEVNIQLVANVGHQSFPNVIIDSNEHWWAMLWLRTWYTVAGVGYYGTLGGEVFKYFTMANSWQRTDQNNPDQIVKLSSSVNGVGLCWNSRSELDKAQRCIELVTHSNNSTQENVEDDVNQITREEFVNIVESETGIDFDENSGSSTNNDGANIFTEGNTTHIIHSDYRCSNNLCWKAGGDTNCYDGYEHFAIRNGDINDVIGNRDKYEMCAEVYSSNSISTGNVLDDNYIPPETGDDPKGHPGLVFSDFKLKDSTGKVTDTVSVGEAVNFSYKVKNIGRFEPVHDIYMHVWRSDGKKLDDNPDDMGKDKFDNDDLDPGESVRGDENFTAPTQTHDNGYNFIVCAHYNQYRDNPDEAVGCSETFRFDVTTGKRWDQLTKGEQAAIMHYYF